jgi:hypothetical protein
MLRRTDLLLLALFSVASGSRFGLSITRQHHRGRLASNDKLQFPVSRLYDVRGGSTRILDGSSEDEEEKEKEEVDPEEEKRRLAVQKYRMEQQMLLQLRSTFLSEALAKRGLPITTIQDVSTADGNKPPEKVDWDCAMSTIEEPKSCLFSFDAEPNTKVIAPIDSNQWITLSALNRLRRTDPTKVEPLWHNQYAILQSWFGDDSEYSMLQHVGVQGLFITLLLDTARGLLLKTLLVAGILSVVIVFMPILEFLVNRILTSGFFWLKWPTWGRIVHAALPLKLLLGQMAWKFLANSFGKLENRVRDYIVDVECAILEESIPLTVGPGSEVMEEDIDIAEDEDGDIFFDASEAVDDFPPISNDEYIHSDSDGSDW